MSVQCRLCNTSISVNLAYLITACVRFGSDLPYGMCVMCDCGADYRRAHILMSLRSDHYNAMSNKKGRAERTHDGAEVARSENHRWRERKILSWRHGHSR